MNAIRHTLSFRPVVLAPGDTLTLDVRVVLANDEKVSVRIDRLDYELPRVEVTPPPAPQRRSWRPSWLRAVLP